MVDRITVNAVFLFMTIFAKIKRDMNIKEIDSTKLLFDLQATDLVGQFTKRFPEFESYEGKVEAKKVCQYLILMCDIHSPMIQDKPDYFQRKYAVALMLKFPTSKKEFTKEAEEIIIGENEVVNQVMVSYILSYGLPSYGLFQAFTALIAFEMQKIYGGNATKDSQNILDKATAKVQALERELFRSGEADEYSKIRMVLYSRAEKERENLRPEHMIRTLEDTGELPEGCSPYPEDYKIDPLKDLLFLGDHAIKK